jgi:diadenosine tetraphosphate (Ap4A) HIT family hydrolase
MHNYPVGDHPGRGHISIGSVMTDQCALCSANEKSEADLPPRERVFNGDHWRVAVHESALPGWLLVISKRHIPSLADMNAEEAASLGSVLSNGTTALGETVGSLRTYAMMFAEATAHVHFNLVPRMADIPDHLKGAAVGGYNREGTLLTADERDALALRLVAAWPEA